MGLRSVHAVSYFSLYSTIAIFVFIIIVGGQSRPTMLAVISIAIG